ncbi:hypothetical protein FIBSPDRAFT_958015 [Athelia psychrophila]|uniref:Uncharacterized protein n=1 Tax=Athelia psychrophila TaxID=1759441 RepID=A0A166F579_9AGAM|nr:hypothetical protein FIBSPDRAFT_958015 [Fibularhizoctonia sp. CBS 109695]
MLVYCGSGVSETRRVRLVLQRKLAVRAASESLSKDPENVKAQYRRGVARKHTDLLKAAMSDFKNILRIDHQRHEAHAELAMAMELWAEGEGDETAFNTSKDEASASRGRSPQR